MTPVGISELFPIGLLSVALAVFVLGTELYLWPREPIENLVTRATMNGVPSFIAAAISFVSTMLFELPAGLTYIGYLLWGYSFALMFVGTTLQFVVRRRKHNSIESLLS